MAYDRDLATIHDRSFGALAEAAADLLHEELERAGRNGGTIVDLGCGGGALCRRFSERGYRTLGIDLSPAMIALARRRVPAAELRVGSIHSEPLPSCVAVAAIGECVNYLPDENDDGAGTRAGLARLADRVFTALDRGGLFRLDVAAPGRIPREGVSVHHEGDGWAVLMDAELEAEDLLARRITTFRRRGRSYRRSHEVHRLRLFDRATVLDALRRVGFRVRAERAYGELELPPGLIAYRARKP